MAQRDIADVLIIGSGASGAVCAWHLSTVPGLKVVCLEQGDWRSETPRNFFADPEGIEQAHRLRLLSPPPRRKGAMYFEHGYPYDFTESVWAPILGVAVGGATTHYGAQWHRFKPSDFKIGTITGVGDDWPITYWDVAPYYDWIDNFVGVTGVPGNPAYPPNKVKYHPAYPLSKPAAFAARGFEKLGWHHWPSEAAVITVPHNGRKPCTASVQTPGHLRGDEPTCPNESKNRADIVFWPIAIKNGVELRTRATVREITINDKGLADGALYYDAAGKLHEQKARIVIVGCNAIGTARLLLVSKSSKFPNGLANSNGMVGKYLGGTGGGGGARMTGEVDENLYDPNALTTGLNCHEFYEHDPKRGFYGNVTLRVGDPNVYGTAYTRSRQAALGEDAPGILLASQRGAGIPWGELHHAAFQERAVHTLTISASVSSEPPSPDNRVELDPTLTDDFGTPAPKLFLKPDPPTENGKRGAAWAAARAAELLEALGVRNIQIHQRSQAVMEGAVIPQAGHYNSTCRMGNDRSRFVVDRWGCTHDVPNLFIVDGGINTMARGAGAGTRSIQALALRTADYIKNNARNIPTP